MAGFSPDGPIRGRGAVSNLAQRFHLAAKRLGFAERASAALDTTQFRVPARSGDQLALFDE